MSVQASLTNNTETPKLHAKNLWTLHLVWLHKLNSLNLLHPRWRINEPTEVILFGSWIMPSATSTSSGPALLILQPVHYDQYQCYGQELLRKSLHEMELLQRELVEQNLGQSIPYHYILRDSLLLGTTAHADSPETSRAWMKLCI